MVRTQIQLTEEQAQALKRVARREKVSMAEIIRRSVNSFITSAEAGPSDEERRRRALSLIGCATGGPRDMSVNHDRYLAEIYGE